MIAAHLTRRSFAKQLASGTAAVVTSSCMREPSSPSAANSGPQPGTGKRTGDGGRRLIIDTHVHLSRPIPKHWEKPWGDDGEKVFMSTVEARAERITREMSESGTGLAFAMGQVSDLSQQTDPLGIKDALTCAALVPGVKVVGAIDPRRTGREHLKAVEAQLEQGSGTIVAFKAYLGYVHFGASDPAYMPYYALAEKHRLPVIFHTGDTWSTQGKLKFSHPLGVDEAATTYPSVKFVIAHLGVPWFMDAAEVVWKNDNVWGELAGLYVGDDKSIDQMLRSGLPPAVPTFPIARLQEALTYVNRYDRLVYGTDFPLVRLAPYRRLIETIIPNEHHDNVFRANAERLFGVSVPQPRG